MTSEQSPNNQILQQIKKVARKVFTPKKHFIYLNPDFLDVEQ